MSQPQVRYEKDENGALKRIEESSADSVERADVLNEYAGLLGQRVRLNEDLDVCNARIEALKPFVDEILSEVVAEEDAKKGARDDAKDSEAKKAVSAARAAIR